MFGGRQLCETVKEIKSDAKGEVIKEQDVK